MNLDEYIARLQHLRDTFGGDCQVYKSGYAVAAEASAPEAANLLTTHTHERSERFYNEGRGDREEIKGPVVIMV